MSTDLAIEKPLPHQITITVTAETVEQLQSKASALSLQGVKVDPNGSMSVLDADQMLADKEGLKAIREVIKQAMKTRNVCEKEHKAIKEDAWKECCRIDESRRTLVGSIVKVEDRLQRLEKAVEDELDRRAKEWADKQYAARIQVLTDVDSEMLEFNETLIRAMDDDAFARYVIQVSAAKKRRWEAEEDARRVAEANRLEAERLAEERRLFAEQQAELDRLRKIEQDRINAELDVRRKALEDQERIAREAQAEIDRLRRIEKDRIEADRLAEENRQKEQQAKLDAEARRLESIARVQKEQADQLEADRIAHENELAERAASESRKQEHHLETELMSVYQAMDDTWHDVAAREIVEWMNADDNIEASPDDCAVAFAGIIRQYDPMV